MALRWRDAGTDACDSRGRTRDAAAVGVAGCGDEALPRTKSDRAPPSSLANGPTPRTKRARPRASTATSSRSSASVATTGRGATNASRSWTSPPASTELFWPGAPLAEQKSAGGGLTAALEQASTYCDALPEPERPPCPTVLRSSSSEASGPDWGVGKRSSRLRADDCERSAGDPRGDRGNGAIQIPGSTQRRTAPLRPCR